MSDHRALWCKPTDGVENCMYSRSMHQEYPRKCVRCGKPEVTDWVPQAPPTPNSRPAIADLLLEDIARRKKFGIQKYGTPLQAHNGRDSLMDAYEEVLDLAMYLRQLIEERKG